MEMLQRRACAQDLHDVPEFRHLGCFRDADMGVCMSVNSLATFTHDLQEFVFLLNTHTRYVCVCVCLFECVCVCFVCSICVCVCECVNV